jgi:hypothetical protein
MEELILINDRQFGNMVKELTLPKEIYNLLRLSIINNKRHLEVCNCQKDNYNKIYNHLKQQLNEQINQNTSELVKIDRAKQLPNITYDELFKMIKDVNIVCPYEFDIIKKTLTIFITGYDLTVPKVYSIVEGVVDNHLTVYRLQKESNYEGIVIKDERGIFINPVEEAKRRYLESRTKAIEILDRMIEGSKNVNVNLSVNSKDIKDLYKNIKYPTEPIDKVSLF